jgi:DtxR family Mn-dependent transcriptional regulator
MAESDSVARLNSTEETYIETIDALTRECGYAVVTDIARRLKVKSPSVTGMLKKLDGLGFVKYTPYRNVALTDKGRDLAVFLKNRQKSLETLMALLGVDGASAELDACQIEHVLHASTLHKLSLFVEYLSTAEGAALLERFKKYQSDKK